ncbi:hypothetical protein OY671_009384, partial [Metschnikowia pulcherrima]
HCQHSPLPLQPLLLRRGAPGGRHAVAGAGAGRTVRPLHHRPGRHLRRPVPGHHRPARRPAAASHQRDAGRRGAGHADRHHHRPGLDPSRADSAGGHRAVLRLFHVHGVRQARRPDRLCRPAADDADHAFAARGPRGAGARRRDPGRGAVLRGLQPGVLAPVSAARGAAGDVGGVVRHRRLCRRARRVLRRDRRPGRGLPQPDPAPVDHDREA